jgi:hypothetical protein
VVAFEGEGKLILVLGEIQGQKGSLIEGRAPHVPVVLKWKICCRFPRRLCERLRYTPKRECQMGTKP